MRIYNTTVQLLLLVLHLILSCVKERTTPTSALVLPNLNESDGVTILEADPDPSYDLSRAYFPTSTHGVGGSRTLSTAICRNAAIQIFKVAQISSQSRTILCLSPLDLSVKNGVVHSVSHSCLVCSQLVG